MDWYQIYKFSQDLTPKFYEGDRVLVNYQGHSEPGTIWSIEYDPTPEYYIKYDTNDTNDYEEIWKEDPVPEKSITLLKEGDRWELQPQDYWHLTDYETFTYGSREWDVLKAKRILFKNPRTPIEIKTKSFESHVKQESINIPKKRQNISDTSFPIIMISEIDANGEENKFPIDGWHRISKAIDENIETLKAYVLTPEESKQIEIQY